MDNYIDNFRRPTTPSPRPSRDPSFRQPISRPMTRENYIGGEIRQRMAPTPNNFPLAPAQQPRAEQPNPYTPPSRPEPAPRPVINNQTAVSPVKLEDDIDNLFPLSPVQPGQTRVPASTLVVKQRRLPLAVYAIIGLNLVLFVVSFFNKSNSRLIFSLLTLLLLLFSAGLIFKREDIVRYLTYLSGVAAGLSLMLIVLFYFQASSTNSTYLKNYNEIKSKVAQSLSYQQKQILSNEQARVIARRNKQIKTAKLFYVFAAVVVIEGVFSVVYLRKSEVQKFFVPTKAQSGQAS